MTGGETAAVEALAHEIHQARTLTLPCPDNYDDDLDAWCWEAARLVIVSDWLAARERDARVRQLHEMSARFRGWVADWEEHAPSEIGPHHSPDWHRSAAFRSAANTIDRRADSIAAEESS
jgi:hypothetical protein